MSYTSLNFDISIITVVLAATGIIQALKVVFKINNRAKQLKTS